MAYFKINGVDFSKYVNHLKVATEHLYTGVVNAAGDTVVRYKTTKHTIEVGIIPLDDTSMAALQTAINGFKVTISFLDPDTKTLRENMTCIIPNNIVEYYTVQVGNVKFKAFSLVFNEL